MPDRLNQRVRLVDSAASIREVWTSSGMGDAIMARPGSEPTDDEPRTTALARGVQILQCFSTAAPALSSREIMARTGLPRPTVFRLTRALRQLGLLSYSESRAVFTLSLGMLTLASPVLARMTARQIARPLMQSLADHAQGQVSMMVGENRHMIVVEVAQGASSSVFRMEIGTRVSLARTVTGRAYLLNLPQAEQQAYLDHSAEGDAERRHRLEAKLAETAADLAAKGYATDESEYVRGLLAIAAPMRSAIEGQLAVFSCSVPSFVVDAARVNDIGLRLSALVRNVEASVGHVDELPPAIREISARTRRPER